MRTSLCSEWLWNPSLLLAGATLPLAFAPYDIWPVAIVAPGILFFGWLESSPGQAFLRGWLFGIGMFGVGVSWVYISIYVYGNTSLFVSFLLTSLFIAGMALYPGLLGYLVMRFPPRDRVLRLLLVLPASWTLMEWIRGWFLTGFPWLNLGDSQLSSPLSGIAPILGAYGVSLGVALSAALCVAMIIRPRDALKHYLTVLAVIWGGAALVERVEWTQPATETRQVALIQGNIPQERKWLPEQRALTLDLYTDLTQEQWDKDLIIWPEAAVPDFYHNVAEGFLWALELEAKATQTDLLIGIPIYDRERGRYYNGMISLGSHRGLYTKHRLVPFGEYVPLEGLLRGLIGFFDLPMSAFSAGPSDQAPLRVAGYQAGISICYEIAYANQVIQSLPEANFLVNVSNDTWFGDSIGPHQHLQLARMRALESGRPLLRATNNGISAIIDYRGQLRGRSPQFEVYVLKGEIEPRVGATPFVRLRHYPVLLMLGGMLLTGWRLERRRGYSL